MSATAGRTETEGSMKVDFTETVFIWYMTFIDVAQSKIQ